MATAYNCPGHMQRSLSCVPPARNRKHMVNWKTFSLCYFAMAPQTENVFEITNLLLHL